MISILEHISEVAYVIASFVLAGFVSYRYIWLEWRDDVNKRKFLIASKLPGGKDLEAS